jgi:hypothetical protein
VKTYTFYFVREGRSLAESAFEPRLYWNDFDAFAAAQALIETRPDCAHVVVCFHDRELFRASAPRRGRAASSTSI